MFLKDTLAISINSSTIRILIGNKVKIKLSGVIETPEGSFLEDKILNVESIYEVIARFLKDKSLKPKAVSFTVKGQDIVVRHIETPIMEEKSVREAVEWEIKQYLPEEGINHYIDFEVLEKVKEADRKVYKVLAVATPKDKIDKYVELADKLQLEVKAIDISANCIARVLKSKVKLRKAIESVGIIDIEEAISRIVILDKGNLFMEREVPFGVENVTREISRRLGSSSEEEAVGVLSEFSFEKINAEDEIERRIQTLFDNVFSSFSKVIQFYSTGRVTKNLGEIYIVGSGCKIKGLGNYISAYFDSPAQVIDKNIKLNARVKLPEQFDFSAFIDVVGLLLRKE